MLYIETEVYNLESAMDRDSVCLFSRFVLFSGTTVCLKAHTRAASNRPSQLILIITMARNQAPIHFSLLLREVAFQPYINVMSETRELPVYGFSLLSGKANKGIIHQQKKALDFKTYSIGLTTNRENNLLPLEQKCSCFTTIFAIFTLYHERKGRNFQIY